MEWLPSEHGQMELCSQHDLTQMGTGFRIRRHTLGSSTFQVSLRGQVALNFMVLVCDIRDNVTHLAPHCEGGRLK